MEKGPAFGAAETGRASDDWPTYRHDAERSAGFPQSMPDEFTQVWKVQCAKPGTGPIDTLSYTPVWARAIYLYAIHRGRPDWLANPNCRATFESFLQQQPASGPATLYVVQSHGMACTGQYEPRDQGLHRPWLNGFWVRQDGRWLECQDKIEPYFSEVAFLRTLPASPSVDACRAVLRDYHGWTNERTCLLVHGAGLAVFDYCCGPEQEVGVRWHLKGSAEVQPGCTALKLRDRRLAVMYPFADNGHTASVEANRDAVPFYQTKASWNLDLIANGGHTGFLTVFWPDRGHGWPAVRAVGARTVDGVSAFPFAMAADCGGGLMIGSRTGRYSSAYVYDWLGTDAEVFAATWDDRGMEISFVNGRTFCLPACAADDVRLDGRPIAAGRMWHTQSGLTIELDAPATGTLHVQMDRSATR